MRLFDAQNIEKTIIFNKRRCNIHRKIAVYLIKAYTNLLLRETGELFDMNYTTVSMATKRFKKNLEKD